MNELCYDVVDCYFQAVSSLLAPLFVSQSVCGPYSLNEKLKIKDSELEGIEWEASQLSRVFISFHSIIFFYCLGGISIRILHT